MYIHGLSPTPRVSRPSINDSFKQEKHNVVKSRASPSGHHRKSTQIVGHVGSPRNRPQDPVTVPGHVGARRDRSQCATLRSPASDNKTLQQSYATTRNSDSDRGSSYLQEALIAMDIPREIAAKALLMIDAQTLQAAMRAALDMMSKYECSELEAKWRRRGKQ
jgi:hypothetical protein